MSEENTIEQALLNVQKKIGKVTKNKVNPFHKSKYADYEAVLDVVKEPLNDEGFIIIHRGIIDNGKDYYETELKHVSGKSISSRLPLSINGNPQHTGSILTYYKRYNLSGLLGLACDEDDDGESAMKREVQKPSKAPVRPVTAKKPTPSKESDNDTKPWGVDGRISLKQGKRLFAIAIGAGVTEDQLKEYLEKSYGIEHTHDITWKNGQYEDICKWAEEQGESPIQHDLDREESPL